MYLSPLFGLFPVLFPVLFALLIVTVALLAPVPTSAPL